MADTAFGFGPWERVGTGGIGLDSEPPSSRSLGAPWRGAGGVIACARDERLAARGFAHRSGVVSGSTMGSEPASENRSE